MGMKLVTPVADPPMAGQSPDPLSADEIKRRKKEWKRRHDAVRTLDSWERYRALVDASEEAFEIIDIANREARFALIVMGALNAHRSSCSHGRTRFPCCLGASST